MAYIFFKRRPMVLTSTATPVTVTITGSGNSSKCYAIINGTTYTAATTDIEVYTGDIIALHVYGTGTASSYSGTVIIDGSTVTSGPYRTYYWTVPSDVGAVSIDLLYASSSSSTITVTTAYRRFLPTGYTRMVYIESSGTQYIDTGFTPDSNTRVIADIETTTTAPSANKWVFGCRSSSATQRFELVYIPSTSAFRFYFNTSYNAFSGVTLGRLLIDVSQSAATVNGVSVTPTEGTFEGACSMCICSGNNSGTAEGLFSQKVYSFQIYDNGALVRDFVPCLNASGVAGLYDVVNDTFYTDAAGGTFISG